MAKKENKIEGPELEVAESGIAPIDFNGIESEDLPQLAGKLALVEAMFRLITKDLSYNDFVRELLLTLMTSIRCEAGSILEVDQNTKSIFFRAAAGNVSDKVVRFSIPLGKGIVGHVVESKQTLNVDDIESNQMHLNAIAKAIGFRPRGLVAAPLLIRGKVYGVVELINRTGEKNFTDADIDFINYFCEYASCAIEMRILLANPKKKAA